MRPQRGPPSLKPRQGRQPLPLAKGRCHNHHKASPMAGLGGSGKPLLTSLMAGSGGLRKASVTATRPTSPQSEARETTAASSPVSSAPTVVPPLTVTARPSSAATATVTAQPLAASTVTAPGTQLGPSYIPQGLGNLLWVESPAPPRNSSPCLLGWSCCPPYSS